MSMWCGRSASGKLSSSAYRSRGPFHPTPSSMVPCALTLLTTPQRQRNPVDAGEPGARLRPQAAAGGSRRPSLQTHPGCTQPAQAGTAAVWRCGNQQPSQPQHPPESSGRKVRRLKKPGPCSAAAVYSGALGGNVVGGKGQELGQEPDHKFRSISSGQIQAYNHKYTASHPISHTSHPVSAWNSTKPLAVSDQHYSDIRPNRQFFQWPDFPPTWQIRHGKLRVRAFFALRAMAPRAQQASCNYASWVGGKSVDSKCCRMRRVLAKNCM